MTTLTTEIRRLRSTGHHRSPSHRWRRTHTFGNSSQSVEPERREQHVGRGGLLLLVYSLCVCCYCCCCSRHRYPLFIYFFVQCLRVPQCAWPGSRNPGDGATNDKRKVPFMVFWPLPPPRSSQPDQWTLAAAASAPPLPLFSIRGWCFFYFFFFARGGVIRAFLRAWRWDP